MHTFRGHYSAHVEYMVSYPTQIDPRLTEIHRTITFCFVQLNSISSLELVHFHVFHVSLPHGEWLLEVTIGLDNGLVPKNQKTVFSDDKTELVIITTSEELSKISDISIKVCDKSISPSDDPPRNLGVIFDSTCRLGAHIAKLCRSSNSNLFSVGKIRKYIDGPTAENG